MAMTMLQLSGSYPPNPDPREDLESRSPNLGPYLLKGTLIGTPERIYFLDPPINRGKGSSGLSDKTSII